MTPLAPHPIRTPIVPGVLIPEAWSKWFRDIGAILGFDNNHSRIMTPALTGFAITGTVARTLVFAKHGNVVQFHLILAPTGGGTVATTAGTSSVDNLPFKASHDAGASAVNAVSLASLGGARVDADGTKLYLPTIAATGNKIIVSGWYRTEE